MKQTGTTISIVYSKKDFVLNAVLVSLKAGTNVVEPGIADHVI